MKNIDFHRQEVDPDKDFSYIDKKIEDVLGHYQKDFMDGHCPDIQGATVGGYGSFLPMQQLSASVLSVQKTQRKSSQSVPSKEPMVMANHSLPIKPVPESSAYSLQEPSESGISSANKQMKLQGVAKCASDNQFGNPVMDCPKKNLLKFRVKVPAQNVLSYNNSAICSRLECVPSLSSYLEDSRHGTPLGMEERKPESPSAIIEVMTTFPLPRDEILSPLRDNLVRLTEKVDDLEIAGLGCSQVHNVDNIHGNACLGRQREASNDKNSKVMDPSRDRKLKQKEQIQCLKPMKLFRETPKFLAHTAASSITGRKGSGASGVGVVAASNAAISEMDASFAQSVLKDEVKEEVLSSSCSKKDIASSKGGGIGQKGSKDKGVGSVCVKSVKENCKYVDTIVDMKNSCVGSVESLKQTKILKATSRSHLAAGTPTRKECSSSMVMKKFRKNQGDGISASVPTKGSVAGSASAENKAAKYNIPSKSQKDMSDLLGKVRKDYNVSSDAGPTKKGNGVSSFGFQTAVLGRPAHTFPSKPAEKLSIKKKGFVSNTGSNTERNMADGNNVTETIPVADVPSVPAVSLDNWVQCDKCEKWRLLPMGMETESLPKEWICSMLTWLPGKNRCSVSEEETNEKLDALYKPLVPVPQLHDNKQAYVDGTVLVGASVGPQHVDLSGQSTKSDAITNEGKRRNLVKRRMDVVRCSGSKELIPFKKNQNHSNDISNSVNQNKHNQEHIDVRKSGNYSFIFCANICDSKPMKSVKKRAADPELSVSEVPKKMKEMHPRSMENTNLVNQIKFRDEKQSCDPCALHTPQDYSKRSLKLPNMRVKNNTEAENSVKNSQQKDISGKKRKWDQQNVIDSTEELYGQVPSKNWVKGSNSGTELKEEKKEKKLKASNVRGRKPTIDKGNGRCYSDVANSNLGCSDDKSSHMKGRMDNASQRIAEAKKVSGKALDSGLSDNATASSSSIISCKFKRKSGEIKSSPVGSVSSSSFKISMTDADKRINKMSVSCNELDEFLAVNQVKYDEEDVFNEFAPHSERMIVRKSNLSRSSGAVPKDTLVRKIPEGKDRGGCQTNNQTNSKVDYEDDCEKADYEFQGGRALTSQQNFVSRNHVVQSSSKLHSDTNSGRETSLVSQIVNGKELSYYPHGVLETGRESESPTINVNIVKPKHSQADGILACLRHPHFTGYVSEDVEASNTKKGSSHFAANTAFMEATHLKDSADHLKISGSTLQSTEVFFQAALKFLHGASLLESGNHRSSRYEEMKSTEAYSMTAGLCEYCAQEYEKHDNLASAALAYKCMEVAYMRVVYCSNHSAIEDSMELKMAISVAPPVESPSSSSASDIDNLSNQAARGTMKYGHTILDHRIHVISAGNRPKFLHLLNFTEKINQAMEAARKSQRAFASANPVLAHAGNHKVISAIKSVLNFSFHDIDELLHRVHLATEALKN